MRISYSVIAGVVAVLGVGVAPAASSARAVSVSVRDGLTSKTELRGSVRFAQPSGWKRTAGGGKHSYVRFRVVEGECTLDLTTSVRGVMTGTGARAQIENAIGESALGGGSRPGGAWGTGGPTVRGGEGERSSAGLYGIAPVRVAAKRYGQLRIIGRVHGCEAGSPDAIELLDAKGPAVRGVNAVLKSAKVSLRVVRVK